MFSWFRRYVQKIGIFGVEVEFRPPNDTSTTVPPPAVDIGFVQPVLPSDQLIAILQNNVGPGQVTTYGECSQWVYGHTGGGLAVGQRLEAAAKLGHQVLTNRVVGVDGSCGAADQAHGQSAQLRREGVPFIKDKNKVDMRNCPPVVLPARLEN